MAPQPNQSIVQATLDALADQHASPRDLGELAIQAAHVHADELARQLILRSQQRAAEAYAPNVF